MRALLHRAAPVLRGRNICPLGWLTPRDLNEPTSGVRVALGAPIPAVLRLVLGRAALLRGYPTNANARSQLRTGEQLPALDILPALSFGCVGRGGFEPLSPDAARLPNPRVLVVF